MVPNNLRIGIVGSRRWHSREAVEELVNVLPLDCTIVSGGCRGVDRHGLSMLIKLYSRPAG